MPPKQKSKDKLSDIENALLDIAVQLYCAVKYHEEHKGEVSEAWLVQGIENKLVCQQSSYVTHITYWLFQDSVNEIFDEESHTLRIHPIITLIGEEWQRAGEQNTTPNFNAFSLAKVATQCKLGAAEHPQWISKLHRVNLSHLLWSQNSVHWWLPGEKMDEEEEDNDDDDEEDEEELPGAWSSCLPHAVYAVNDFGHCRRSSEPALGAHIQGCSTCTHGCPFGPTSSREGWRCQGCCSDGPRHRWW